MAEAGTKGKETLQRKSVKSPDETRTFPKGKLDVVNFGNASVGFATFEPGWKWSECVKPIAGTRSCEAAHFGYALSGRMKIVMDDGSQTEIKAGDVFSIAPGHDAWIIGDQVFQAVDFGSSVSQYAKK